MFQSYCIRVVGVAAALSSILLTGCATIAHGEHQKMTVLSTPSKAMVKVDGIPAGKTPVHLSLIRSKDHFLAVSLPGYQTQTVHLQKTLSGWIFGNLFIGGILGIAIDWSDGAMYQLTPQQLSAYQSKNQHFDQSGDRLTIVMVPNALKHWRKIGQLKKT